MFGAYFFVQRASAIQAVSQSLVTLSPLVRPGPGLSVQVRRVPKLGAWALVALLGLVALVEWRQYSLPMLAEWFKMAAHRCGLR